ncbi:Cof-type HAD-IIB family hydrolase [Gracilibacillus caseinilyticus]|uniref:Cof-type HAD-IIB family hydrolase n=1 Tax=Gracilibacillus caseinilyticus TaxID=2932256 RepID=A0ABY4ER08_9BACI|nr:HAD-IIB family hydrolase [Gracilibacillus caseinilyticus]UOQ46866.1 Cof-type HAD-IIB family hydrolase [Gracilibacillus caseinilyticus]
MNKLYISDLDGTLLNNDARISDFTKKTLIDLLANGLDFTIASARSIHSIKHILGELPFKLPVIEFNGAYISNYETGQHEIVNNIEKALLIELYSELQNCDCTPFISSFDGRDDCLYYDIPTNDGMNYYLNARQQAKDKRLREGFDVKQIFSEQVVCLTFIHRQDSLQDFYFKIKEKFGEFIEVHFFEHLYSPGWYWFTIHDKRATKDQAIKVLQKQYGLSASYLTVFGDESNDIKMFKAADQAVAVKNAIADLNEVATSFIGTNEDDSVVKYILSDRL